MSRPRRRTGVLLILGSCVALTACERAPSPSPAETPREIPGERPGGAATGETSRADGATAEAKPAPSPDAATGFGVLSGRVVFRGPLPASTSMYVPEAGELEAHTIIVDSRTLGLKNAVIWVEDAPSGVPAAHLPTLVLDQENWTFVPHVLAVRAGQTVRFLNSDVANHNIHSLTPGSEFNLGFPLGSEVTYRFRRPTGTRPSRLDCDIHDWMRAWVYVFRHDVFAVTDDEGRFRIEGAPAGRRRLVIHHADGDLQATREVVIEAGGETRVELELGADR